jgi:23S rRNA (uracil1939-C5)-methyltransferase
MPLSNPIELDIEKVVYGGDALARLPAGVDSPAPSAEVPARRKAVFLPFVLPGERVRAVIEEQTRSFARARALQVLQPSPRRISPGCEYFGRCGGCQLQEAELNYQQQLKVDILRETLHRTGGIDWTSDIHLHASRPWEYRNRTRLRFTLAAAAQPSKQAPRPLLGYYEFGSHRLLPITHCPISSRLINDAIQTALTLPSPPPSTREVEFFADADDQNLLATFYFAHIGGEERDYAALAANALHGCISVAAATEESRVTISGDGHLEYKVGTMRFRVSHGAFFQVNCFLIEDLQREVTSGLGGEHTIDLFSGVGLFALPLADAFREVAAVESNAAAADDLRFNLRSRANAHASAIDAQQFIARWHGPADLVVADPPRGGLGPRLITSLIALAPARIHLVSCDPATLGRDLRALLAAGYAIQELHLFDLFPQTYHIESVVKLVR